MDLVVCPALPRPPTSLVVTDVTANSARLTWNPGNTDPVQSYVVQYRHKYSSNGLYDEIFDVAATEYTVVGLSAHTAYEFRVVAVNTIGRSLPSTPVDVTTGELGMYHQTGLDPYSDYMSNLHLLLFVVEE